MLMKIFVINCLIRGEAPLGYSANSPPTPFIERRARRHQVELETPLLVDAHESPALEVLFKTPSNKNSLCPVVADPI